MLFITRPARSSGKAGAAEMGPAWISKIAEETKRRITKMVEGKTTYLISAFGNVVCLSMISQKSNCSRTVNVINFLEAKNDVSNGVKLGLFVSGACREECLAECDPVHVKTEPGLPELSLVPVVVSTATAARESKDTGELARKSDSDEQYDEEPENHKRRASSALSYFSDEKMVETKKAKLTRARERKARRKSARQDQQRSQLQEKKSQTSE